MILLMLLLFVDSTVPFGRSVNLEFEASVLLEPKELIKHKSLLRSAKEVIKSLQAVITPKPNLRPVRTSYPRDEGYKVFTKFVDDLAIVLSSYKDDALRDLTKNLYLETQNYYDNAPKTSVFHNPKLKKTIVDKLQEFALTQPKQLRFQIRRFLRSYKNENFYEFVDNLNEFFDVQDSKVLDKIIEKFKLISRRHNFGIELGNTVKDALDFVVLNRYERMSSTSKEKLYRELHKKLDFGNPEKKFELELEFGLNKNDGLQFRRENRISSSSELENVKESHITTNMIESEYLSLEVANIKNETEVQNTTSSVLDVESPKYEIQSKDSNNTGAEEKKQVILLEFYK